MSTGTWATIIATAALIISITTALNNDKETLKTTAVFVIATHEASNVCLNKQLNAIELLEVNEVNNCDYIAEQEAQKEQAKATFEAQEETTKEELGTEGDASQVNIDEVNNNIKNIQEQANAQEAQQ
jgi:DNA integrity scanning protein DisA with diadenylate cyclase activity